MEENKQDIVLTPDALPPEFQMPDYTPQAFYTRKQVSKAKKRKLRKIAYASKRFNRKYRS